MRKLVPIREALDDPHILGGLLDGPSWLRWRVLLIAIMGEPLTDEERTLFQEVTGRAAEPGERVEEFWGVIGRRGGKSRAMSVLAAYLAVCVDWSDKMAPGELGILPVLAASVRQASIALGYISAIFGDKGRPLFNHLLANETAETVELSNDIVIEVRPASYKTSRGITAISVICDEIAFWSSGDGAMNPDVEILNAMRPALATTGGILIAISSPYARKGELWSTYAEHYGPQGDKLILVVQAASIILNPTLPQRTVDKALARDRSAASAEYLALFRVDIETFISLDKVEAAVRPRQSVPYQAGKSYVGFIDPAGGSGSDSFAMAIAHGEGDLIILDVLDEQPPPFSPDKVAERFSARFREYYVYKVQSDKYAGDWPAERFKVHGVTVETSAEPKSVIYGALLPALNAERVELLENERLRSQLTNLERRANPGGRDTIDHPRGGHDDVVNAAAGAIVQVTTRPKPFVVTQAMLDRFSQVDRARLQREAMGDFSRSGARNTYPSRGY